MARSEGIYCLDVKCNIFSCHLSTNNNRNKEENVAQKNKYWICLKELTFMLLTFGLTVFAWIFFRAENIGHAISYISEIF